MMRQEEGLKMNAIYCITNKVCKGKPKHITAGGFHWRYATEQEAQDARRGILHR